MNFGPMEIAILLGVALLFFGPKRLPGLGKSMGEAIRGFKKGISSDPDEALDVTDKTKKEVLENSESKVQNSEAQKQRDKV